MKRFRRPVHAVGRDEWRLPFAVSLTGFLVLCLLAGSQAWAASPAGVTMLAQATPGQAQPAQGETQAPIGPQTPPSPITPYVAAAYSIVGPINVSSVSAQDIVLYTGANNLGIDLTGKNVVVIDQNSRPLTLSAVQKGTRVYVCRKDNNVVVVVLPAITATGGANR